MEFTVVKTSIVLREKGQKDKILWAFVDKEGHTIIQVYSEKYPIEMEKFLKG
jgi:hypothetical protein